MKPDRADGLRIATFGIRTLPPSRGAAGADTFANELCLRLVQRGHHVTAYCRKYENTPGPLPSEYQGIKLIHLPTVSRSGFDTLIHSFLCTLHILIRNTADVVHVHNGGNSIWALFLRMFRKRVVVSQDGIDWKRAKWPRYAQLYLRVSMYFTGVLPNEVVFDNVFAKQMFEKKFKRRFAFVPYGSDFSESEDTHALQKHGLREKDYFLFVGRFIPEKGVHYLINAFERVSTEKKLVILGGSPNPNHDYENSIRSSTDPRLNFLGYVYGDEMLQLMKHCYCYVQPSDVEGLSPVILTAMGSGVPVICSDIDENVYAVGDAALLFERGNIESLEEQLNRALTHPDLLESMGRNARERALKIFSWDKCVGQFEEIFQGNVKDVSTNT